MSDREAMNLARDLVRGSIIEDAAARFISQVLKEAHDSRIKPLRDRIEELEAKLAKAVEALKFHNAAVELCIGEVTPAMKEAHYHTKRTLAELTGGKDG